MVSQFGFYDWAIYRQDGTVRIGSCGQNSSTNGIPCTTVSNIVHRVEFGVAGLPIELVSFIATSREYVINLNWQTATELNNYGFEIERKTENTDFIKIGFVEGNGTSNTSHSYTYVDKIRTNGKVQYRLKQIDRDGVFKYYGPVEVTVSAPKIFSLEQNYPNPFNPSTTIRFGVPNRSRVRIEIINTLGQRISTLVNEERDAGIGLIILLSIFTVVIFIALLQNKVISCGCFGEYFSNQISSWSIIRNCTLIILLYICAVKLSQQNAVKL